MTSEPPQPLRLFLRDRNRGMGDAWRAAFAGVDAAQISTGDIFGDDAPTADALLSPANSFGFMDGGIDRAYLDRFGVELETRLRALIHAEHDGELPVGLAVIVPTADTPIAWLVSAPTMRVPMEVSRTPNAFLAFRAALRAIRTHNAAKSSSSQQITSLLCPGLATAIGKMPYERCARQMRLAWDNVMNGVQWRMPAEAKASQHKLLE